MIKANLAVGVVAAGLLALLLGAFVYTLGPGPMREPTSPGSDGTTRVGGTADAPAVAPAPGGTGAGAPGGAGAGAPGQEQPAAVRPAPPVAPTGPVVTGSGGRSGATGGPVVMDPVAVCVPTLLQTMLGLVTATLGGRGAC